MQGDASRLRKALQPVCDHLRAQGADLLALKAQVDDSVGAAGEVDDGPGEGFVEGGVATAEAGEGLTGAEGVGECCAECEEDVFCCVVVVDWGEGGVLLEGRNFWKGGGIER